MSAPAKEAGQYERPDEWVGGNAPPQEKAITMSKRTGPRQRGAEVTERPGFFLGGSEPVRPTGPRRKLKSNWIQNGNDDEEGNDEHPKHTGSHLPTPHKLHIGSTFEKKDEDEHSKHTGSHLPTPHKLHIGSTFEKKDEEEHPKHIGSHLPTPGKLHIGSTFEKKDAPDKDENTHHHVPSKLAVDGAMSKSEVQKSHDADTHHDGSHASKGDTDDHKKETQDSHTPVEDQTPPTVTEVHQEEAAPKETPKEADSKVEHHHQPKREAEVEKDAGHYERPDDWVGGHAPPQEKAITMKKSTTGRRQRGAEITERPGFFLGGSQPVVPTGPKIKLKSSWITNKNSSEERDHQPTRGVSRSKTHEGLPGMKRTMQLKKSMKDEVTPTTTNEKRPSVVRSASHGTHELRNSILEKAIKQEEEEETAAVVQNETIVKEAEQPPKEDTSAVVVVAVEESHHEESKPKKDAHVERDAGHYERPDDWVGGHAPPQEKAITMKKSSGPRQRGAEVTERPGFFLGGSQPVIPTGPKIKLKSTWITK